MKFSRNIYTKNCTQSHVNIWISHTMKVIAIEESELFVAQVGVKSLLSPRVLKY